MGPRATTEEGHQHHHYMMEKNETEVVVMKKFGDEQSNLLDKFERLSFEVHLNRAMKLGRSLSEPGAMVRAKLPPPYTAAFLAEPPALVSQVRQGRRRRSTGLKKVLKKLLKSITSGRSINGGGKKEVQPDPRDPRFWKNFSRSLRF